MLQTRAPTGGEREKSRRPPPWKKNLFNYSIWGGGFLLISPYGGLSYGGAVFLMWGPFATFSPYGGGGLFPHVESLFVLIGGAFLGLPPPPPLRKFLRAPMVVNA